MVRTKTNSNEIAGASLAARSEWRGTRVSFRRRPYARAARGSSQNCSSKIAVSARQRHFCHRTP